MQVVAVGYAPVKGTRHTAHDAVRVEAGGVVGDRELCAVDVDRRRVLRTVQHPALLQVRAERHGPGGGQLRLVLPDGTSVDGPLTASGEELTCDYWGRDVALRLLTGPHADLLTAHLGRPVRLAAAPPGAVVYGDPVSLVTTASLRAVADQLGCRPDEVAAARFRADVVLDGEQPFAEDAWRECELDLGSARVRVTGLVPRCAVVDHDPVTGERDRPVLRALVALAQQRGADGRDGPPFGLEAVVVRPGDVRVGDAAALRPARAAQPR
ncbi:MOSC domain-containing protein [Nocardioides perillae]|uniref:MOSC domain-containing protein n=1 Tax=Nocardioides perillae TaxID=1119534 RepID=A0A7Y9RQ30_9ACTN|nr:hypothetical protein [Nocardioides perillae]